MAEENETPTLDRMPDIDRPRVFRSAEDAERFDKWLAAHDADKDRRIAELEDRHARHVESLRSALSRYEPNDAPGLQADLRRVLNSTTGPTRATTTTGEQR